MNQDREPLPLRVEGLPPLPPGAVALLGQGLTALHLDDLPPPVIDGMADHLRLLLAWNQSINLSAIRDAEAGVREHILDSLTAVNVLRERGIGALLDLGSGGGYPGIPLALALPAHRTLLIESVGKKASFLSAAAALVTAESGAGEPGRGAGEPGRGAGEPGSTAAEPRSAAGEIDVFNGRAEELAADRRHRERWPAVVARAIAALSELAEVALPLVARGGVLVAWKRRPLDAELAAAGPALEQLGGAPPLVLRVALPGLEDHVLVVIEKVGSTPVGYPRDPAQRRRHPVLAGERLPSP